MQLEVGRGRLAPGGAGVPAAGYHLIRRAIELLTVPSAAAPAVADLPAALGVSPAYFAQEVALWCGLSAEDLVAALGIAHARRRLVVAQGVLERGTAANGAVHDFEVRIVATISEDGGRGGRGLDMAYGLHACPFGEALVVMSAGGICGLAFVDEGSDESQRAALADMMRRWPHARFRATSDETGAVAAQIFGARGRDRGAPVPLTLIGTPFDLSVWRTLLRIPRGALVSYTDIACHLGHPTAARAVGTANGRNPISFVVPCHRALRGDGSLGGYYWGLTRKRALIAWEAGKAQH